MRPPPRARARTSRGVLVRLAFAAAVAGSLAGCSPSDRGDESASLRVSEPQPLRAANAALIARGAYLAAAGGCAGCHTARGGGAYAGGLEIATAFGIFTTPNITPDVETGIGRWSAEDFWRAMHEGRSRDGALLYPAFPYTNYTKVTRADCDAIYAYLMAQAPVRMRSAPHRLRFPYDRRELLLAWRALYFSAGEYVPDPARSAAWNRGAYLVGGLGHCDACHAARNAFGAVSRSDGVNGGLIPVQNWYAPALTASRESGLGDWDTGEIVDLLRSGVSEHSAVFGPMSVVVRDGLQYLSVVDLQGIAEYLKSQGASDPDGPVEADADADPAALDAIMRRGARIYHDACSGCHQEHGEGVPRVYPRLAGNAAIAMRNPVNLIRVTLNGGFPPSTGSDPRPYGMPPFAQVLADDDVAAVVSYVRRSWGNRGGMTRAIDVARARGVPLD
ncbi:MAG TPA: cytochrome c [Burkholderiaceae bacterium]|nr:cytochrome c [Burkholderiaceae bacterium]